MENMNAMNAPNMEMNNASNAYRLNDDPGSFEVPRKWPLRPTYA